MWFTKWYKQEREYAAIHDDDDNDEIGRPDTRTDHKNENSFNKGFGEQRVHYGTSGTYYCTKSCYCDYTHQASYPLIKASFL
jgi:hypothetical protein